MPELHEHWFTRFVALLLGIKPDPRPEIAPIDFSTPVGRSALERRADEYDKMADQNVHLFNYEPEFYRAQADHYRESSKQ